MPNSYFEFTFLLSFRMAVWSAPWCEKLWIFILFIIFLNVGKEISGIFGWIQKLDLP